VLSIRDKINRIKKKLSRYSAMLIRFELQWWTSARKTARAQRMHLDPDLPPEITSHLALGEIMGVCTSHS
jgi:hypothetical protein